MFGSLGSLRIAIFFYDRQFNLIPLKFNYETSIYNFQIDEPSEIATEQTKRWVHIPNFLVYPIFSSGFLLGIFFLVAHL